MQCNNLAPRACRIKNIVNDQRRRFLAPICIEVVNPSQAQLLNVALVDLRQLGKALLQIGATVSCPVVIANDRIQSDMIHWNTLRGDRCSFSWRQHGRRTNDCQVGNRGIRRSSDTQPIFPDLSDHSRRFSTKGLLRGTRQNHISARLSTRVRAEQ